MAVPAHTSVAGPTEVLIVEDDPDVRELLAEHLRSRGCRVGTIADGAAAIAALRRAGPAFRLIFCDLYLPGADGFAVLEAARAVNPSTCVVIITGYASLDSAVRAVRLGAYDYLAKPFTLGQIDVVLRRVEERTALEAENRRLMHRLGEQETQPPTAAQSAHTLIERLAQIEQRLAAIETALRELSADVRRRRG